MDLHKKKMIDCEQSLPNIAHENYCQEYVRLDIEDRIVNKKARRLKAYRFSFPETINDNATAVNRRACNLMRNKEISERISFLYEEEGSSVENEYFWTKSKAETVLAEIVYDENNKDADRINAVKQLNQMRGLDVPKPKKEGEGADSIKDFFEEFGGNNA